MKFKKAVVGYAYVFFYLFCLLIFSVLIFPYARLKQKLELLLQNKIVDASSSPSPPDVHVEIGNMRSYWLSGWRWEDINIRSTPLDSKEEPWEITIAKATLRLSLFPLLWGQRKIDAVVHIAVGSIETEWITASNWQRVVVEVSEFELSHGGFLKSLLGLPIEGKIAGRVDLKIPQNDVKKAEGEIAFEASEIIVGDGRAKIKDTLALPPIKLGSFKLNAETKEGVVKLLKLNTSGNDVDLQAEGRLYLQDPFLKSTLDLQVRFRVNDIYKKKSEIAQSLFGAPNSSIPALFDLVDPKVKQAKRADGFYSWHVRGPFKQVDVQPIRASSASGLR
ncbi:type II secretion system protein GspN [Pajaroellobacter abortibovis]|uniref:Type II secretion system protein GspN n=1 Tax=Pajaroellobacter abortibovis TaxID=1882918 RepID=A0A1L6MX64_9BACT|nr:type II secretion system protein GspN [Pajaroellobacter abortibovis]APS00026.1 type II secretion system protein GspN [Pajaroellobacter abortibovis]